jgi:predicted secreted protein
MGTDVKGRSGKLAVSADGITYTALGGVSDVTFSSSRGVIEVTDFDSAGWKENLSGIGTMTLSVSLNYNEDDSGQDIVWTANEAGNPLWIRWRPRGDLVDGVAMQYIFKSYITTLDETQAFDGACELSLDVESTAAPTIQVQPVP